MTALRLRELRAADWVRVCAIYEQGIVGGNATFETAAPSWEDWDRRHRADCRFVAELGGEVVGWAALVPLSHREAYAGVAELSVYVDAGHRGVGVGSALLDRLIAASEDAAIWTLQAGIFPENDVSIRLHLRAGFREVGRRERFGVLDGVWRDVVLLERRSRLVGWR